MEYAVQSLKFLMIIGVLLYAMYFLAKKVKKKQMNVTSQNGVVTVLDVLQFNMNEKVYLLKIGEETVIYASNANGVSMTKINGENLTVSKEKFDDLFGSGDPGSVLKNVKKSIGDKFR